MAAEHPANHAGISTRSYWSCLAQSCSEAADVPYRRRSASAADAGHGSHAHPAPVGVHHPRRADRYAQACQPGLARRRARCSRSPAERRAWIGAAVVAASRSRRRGRRFRYIPRETFSNPRGLIAHVPAELRAQPVINEYSMGGPLILAGIGLHRRPRRHVRRRFLQGLSEDHRTATAGFRPGRPQVRHTLDDAAERRPPG